MQPDQVATVEQGQGRRAVPREALGLHSRGVLAGLIRRRQMLLSKCGMERQLQVSADQQLLDILQAV